MGLFICKLEPDIWIRQNRNVYEYISVFVDDLSTLERDPKSLTNARFKLKVTGKIQYNLGCNLFRDSNGAL